MAVTNQESTEFAQAVTYPVTPLKVTEWHGRLRTMEFTTAQDGAGDATSDVKACKLPPGRVKVFMGLSDAYFNWTTASATCDIGWDAYTNIAGTAVAADPNGLADGIDVDAVGTRNLMTNDAGAILAATCGMYEFNSQDGVTILLTSQDVAIIDTDSTNGYITYTVD